MRCRVSRYPRGWGVDGFSVLLIYNIYSYNCTNLRNLRTCGRVLTGRGVEERRVRAGRRRVHVGQLDGRRGGRGVRHGRTVVTGILLAAAVAVVRTGIGLVAVTAAAAVAASTAASAATAAGRRRVYVRAAVGAVGRVRRRRARPVAAAPGRHAAALAASVVVCGHNA